MPKGPGPDGKLVSNITSTSMTYVSLPNGTATVSSGNIVPLVWDGMSGPGLGDIAQLNEAQDTIELLKVGLYTIISGEVYWNDETEAGGIRIAQIQVTGTGQIQPGFAIVDIRTPAGTVDIGGTAQPLIGQYVLVEPTMSLQVTAGQTSSGSLNAIGLLFITHMS